MPTFYAVLASQTDEHKRFVTLSTVPCSKCGGDPVDRHSCKKCKGTGDEAATKESASRFLEAQEDEYAAFRLDSDETIARYPSLNAESLDQVLETTLWYPEDTHLVDGRFVRKGKVTPAAGAQGYTRQHKGWRAFHEQSKPYKLESIGSVRVEMAVTGGLYGVPTKNRSDGTTNGGINWSSGGDTFKTALTTSSYTVDIDTHDFFNDVTNEVTGTGYTAGGATLGTLTSTYDTATDQARFDAADTSWTTSTITARRSVTYKSTGTASTSPLVSYLDFGADVSTTAGTFLITWDSTGIWVVDVT